MAENFVPTDREPVQPAESWFAVCGDVDDFIFYDTGYDEEPQWQWGSRR